MKLLLDTHTFIWWDSDPARLSRPAMAALLDSSNELVISAASIWEMQIKHQLGKLTLRLPLTDIVQQQRTSNGMQVLPVHESHIFRLEGLPPVHRDPFDRMLVAQTLHEQAHLVSADSIFGGYPVPVLW